MASLPPGCLNSTSLLSVQYKSNMILFQLAFTGLEPISTYGLFFVDCCEEIVFLVCAIADVRMELRICAADFEEFRTLVH